jgi:putative ABC transport system substrate-binding protein
VRRRDFITLMGGAAASVAEPLAARAQQATPLVGVLMAGSASAPDNQKRLVAFRQGLADLGWKDGDNLHIEYRWSAGKEDLIVRYAKELVALKPDVILANSTPVIDEFKIITSTVPVVFALSMDPVGRGQVQSLAHPGGNLTGFTFVNPELMGKWMELLKQIAPATKRAAVLFNPATTPTYDSWVREIEGAHHPGAIELVAKPVGTTADMEAAITSLAQQPGSGLIVGPDPFNQVYIAQIAHLADQNRLPAVSVYRPFVAAGGLMMYGPDTADIFRRSAAYIDRVLKGAHTADLPVQQPDKFEFVINTKTAKTIGLDIPPTLLALADEVIE